MKNEIEMQITNQQVVVRVSTTSTNDSMLCTSNDAPCGSFEEDKWKHWPLYQWLEKFALQGVYHNLVNGGYDDMTLIQEQMISSMPLDDRTLRKCGITKPGWRNRLIAHLKAESVAWNDSARQDDSSVCWKRDAKFKYTLPFLIDWLRSISLHCYYSSFVTSGYETLSDLVFLMGTDNPITDQTLEKEIGIDKHGHRQRILFKLQQAHTAFYGQNEIGDKVDSACNICKIM